MRRINLKSIFESFYEKLSTFVARTEPKILHNNSEIENTCAVDEASKEHNTFRMAQSTE